MTGCIPGAVRFTGPVSDMQKWVFATGTTLYSSPSIGADGVIYVGSLDKNLYAINQDGTQKWAFTTGGWIDSSPAIGVDGTIYVGSGDFKLYAINPDGTQKWAFPTGKVSNPPRLSVRTAPFMSARVIVNLYAINPDGTKKWAFLTRTRSVPPRPSGRMALYMSGRMIKISMPSTRMARNNGHFPPAIRINSSPAIGADGTIYVGSEDDKLYAINPDGSQKWAFSTGE